MSHAITARQHDSYGTMTIIAILMPLIGIILGVVYLTKDQPADRKLGEHLTAISILFTIVWSAAWIVLLGVQAANMQPYLVQP